MIEMNFETDFIDVETELKELHISIPNINRKILKKVTGKAKAKIRTAYKNNVNKVTGKLYDSIYGCAKNNEVGYVGIGSKQAYKFETINYGATITPTHDDYLTFKDSSGNWHKVASITIKAHDFFSAGKEYVGSDAMYIDVDNVLTKEVDKILK